MHYGIELGATGICDPRTLAELASLAEAVGWDGIFLEDYIVYWNNGPTYDPWIALAAMAMSTKRIRLGTTATPLPRRRPWKLARELVTLDHLSNGRMILTAGLGGAGIDFHNFGEVIDLKQRAQMLDEALEVLVGLWSGESFSYHGAHYQINEVTFLPKPVQSPRIPIWIGGGYPKKGPLQRAARWDGACMFHTPSGSSSWIDMTPDDVRSLKAFVASQRTSLVGYAIAIGGRERRADWAQERAYIRSLAEAGATWWMEGIEPGELDVLRAKIKRGPLRID